MKKRKYFYVISYNMHDDGGSYGSGCSQIYLDYKIKDISTFNAMLSVLQKENNFKTVVVTNIMCLGRVWAI